jgi:hypothetical protein
VVLLAEASSGKSAEFRNQAETLRAAGFHAFFATIEELADHGFEAALEPATVAAYEQWRSGTRDGWFFLDSIDEARLINRKSFEVALKRFARTLGSSADRARIFISCRVSDWNGTDRDFIERLLPSFERPKDAKEETDPLLDPFFKEDERPHSRVWEEPARKINDLIVIQLVRLSLDQCKTLASQLRIQDVEAFVKGIERNGLEAFPERPGDVIDLAEYWRDFGEFGPFAEMVEHGVQHKLKEPDKYRPDNAVLSPEKAREGADRIAAALTLAKSFTLRAPGYDNDPGLAAGAIDPAAILDKCTDAERNALLRRGIFAPATYGPRANLLRFIREGAITTCADLARGVALDRRARYSHRIVALQALVACKDRTALSAAARDLVADAAKLPSRLSVEAATVLYPEHLSLAELFTLIEQVRPPREFSGEGFGYSIVELYESTAASQKAQFVSRLATLCLSEPFVDWHHRISKRYAELATHVEPIAYREVQTSGNGEPPDQLIRLLMMVEKAEREREREREGPTLRELLHARPKILRALFWADVGEQREHGRHDNNPTYYWQIINPHPLWYLQESDLRWLEDDLAGRPLEADQRIALSAIIAVLRSAGRLDAERSRVEALIGDRPRLEADLIEQFSPSPQAIAHMQREQEVTARHKRERAKKEEKDKESWRRFEKELRGDPVQLRDPEKLKSWRAGAWRLWDLTRWLVRRSEASEETAPTQWRLLTEAFGHPVAEAYRDGLKIHWRATKPERPKRNETGATTINYANILAFAAVGAEAKEDADWTSRLSDEEANRAALHGCLTERSYPDWLDALVASHPRIVLPVIRDAFGT